MPISISASTDSTPFLVSISVLMVVAGSLNTIAAKWTDRLYVNGVAFNHPFFQTFFMFIGEFCCLLVYLCFHYFKKYNWKRHNINGDSGAVIDIGYDEPTIPKFNPLIFLPPASCDVIGTSVMYVGLNLTTASTYQMLRGSVIIFTGLLSVAFLNARLRGYKWLGISFITLGLVIVGLLDIIFDTDPKDDVNGIITGNLLIIIAQIIVAIQMVSEQKFVQQHDVPPLLAVGLEGLFGIIIISILMVLMYFVHVSPTFSKNPLHRLEDVIFALKEIGENPIILLALSGTIVSTAFYNYAGVSVTKYLSATNRMVLDSVRTLIIWAVSIRLFGEKFIPLQLLGFVLLILGMFVYNDLIFGPRFRRDIFPRMSESNPCTLCCASFCGVDIAMSEPLVEDSEEENLN